MAKTKAKKSSSPKEPAAPKAAPQAAPKDQASDAVKAARGLFSINFKFSLFIGLMLTVLLGLVTLIVHNQLSRDLAREVAERGATIARNLAAPTQEAMIGKDDLTLNILSKGVVEAERPETEPAGFFGQIVQDLMPGKAVESAKNEGIVRAIVVDQQENNKDMVIADSKKGAGDANVKYESPPLKTSDDEPFPTFTDEKGNVFYDIASDINITDEKMQQRMLGSIHLYMRRDVVTNAVRIATTRLVAIMLASLFLGVIALSILVRVLMRPIGHLVSGVNAVAAGDFSKEIKLNPNDELGELVDAYNGMAKSLREKEAVQEALAKYTSKDLVNQMLSDKGKLELGGQRVHATIFFSVVRGLAALAGSMEPEKFVGIMNEYLEIETDIIMRNGGSIDKFIGDEVMALWGLKGEDVAEQAYLCVKAGVEIQDAIVSHNAKREGRGEPVFECSAGINTGEVVSGNMGSSVKMDYTVLGGNVNLAARLGLVAAKGGQTIISHATYSQVAERFKIDKLAPMQLKGIKEPVPLYWPRKIV
jgi:class 3 adenylate cyclase